MPNELDQIKALSPAQLAAVHASFANSHKPAKGGNQVCAVTLDHY